MASTRYLLVMMSKASVFCIASLATILSASCGAKPVVQKISQLPAPPPVENPVPAFKVVEGLGPGSEEPYEGLIVSWKRWMDASGEHLLVVSRTESAAINARLYTRSNGSIVLNDEIVDGIYLADGKPSAGLYRDEIFVTDLDDDGYGEAAIVYYVDPGTDSEARRLELVVFVHDKRLLIHGTTRHEKINSPTLTALTNSEPAMSEANEKIRGEAMELFSEAQYELAIPPPFPGFLPHIRFDGALFRGDEPPWSLTILPAFMAFTKEGESAAIKYESISAEGDTIIIEGSGTVEAWAHKFRVTLVEKPGLARDGTKFQYTATMEWSDGTRLSGWGGPVPAR